MVGYLFSTLAHHHGITTPVPWYFQSTFCKAYNFSSAYNQLFIAPRFRFLQDFYYKYLDSFHTFHCRIYHSLRQYSCFTRLYFQGMI